jgi:hypothetical protein
MNGKVHMGGIMAVMFFGLMFSSAPSWVSAEEQKKEGAGDVQERAIPRSQFGGPSGGKMMSPRPGGGVMEAKIDVSCSNGKKFTLDTNSRAGRCNLTYGNGPAGPGTGPVVGGACGDGKGNQASASCQDGCNSATGAGSCTDNSPK